MRDIDVYFYGNCDRKLSIRTKALSLSIKAVRLRRALTTCVYFLNLSLSGSNHTHARRVPLILEEHCEDAVHQFDEHRVGSWSPSPIRLYNCGVI